MSAKRLVTLAPQGAPDKDPDKEGGFATSIDLDDLWAGEMIGLALGGTKVLLVNLDGEILAYEDRCAHKGVALSAGKLEGRILTCRAHEWQYDIATGEGINPRGACLRRFPLKVKGDDVYVDIGDEK